MFINNEGWATTVASPLLQTLDAASTMRSRFYWLLLITFLSLAGCKDNSSDDRLRGFFSIPSNQQLTENAVVEKVATLLPIGTPEALIAEKVQEIGIGKDSLSSYNLINNRNLVAIRVEYDPNTFGVTKSQWIITLQLDAEQRLQTVSAKRYITGL